MNQDMIFKAIAKTEGEQALDAFKKRIEGLESQQNRLAKASNFASSALKTFAAAFTLREVAMFGKSIIDTADHLNDLSQKTGIGVNALSGYQEAAKQAGLSTEGLETSLRFYTKSIAEARGGNLQMVSAFKNLGVSIADLKNKTPEQLISKLADNFTRFKDGPEKAANAMKLFGKSGADIIPFLNQGSSALSKFSLGIDKDFAERADRFNDALSSIGTDFKKSFVPAIKEILPYLESVVKAFGKFPEMLRGTKGMFEGFGEAIRKTAYAMNNLATAAIDLGDATVSGFRAIVQWNKWGQKDSGTKAQKILEGYDDRSNARQRYLDASNHILSKPISMDLGDSTKPKTNRGGTTPSTEGIDGGGSDKIKEFIALRQQENQQLKESLGDYQLTALELKKVQEARKLDKEALKTSLTLSADQKTKLMAATEEIKKQRLALIDMEYQQQRTFGFGAKRAFDDYVENAGNAAKAAQELFSKSFSAMEDSLLEFTKTGIFNFKKFADVVIDEILRIIIRQQIISPIVGAIGGAFTGGATGTGSGSAGGGTGGASYAENGGIMTSKGMAKLNTYARGGIANSPQLAVFGEGSRPEAYVPLPDGRRIPVAMSGEGGGGVIVNVYAGGGATDTKGANEGGKQFGIAIGNMVKTELIKQKRPGGLLT